MCISGLLRNEFRIQGIMLSLRDIGGLAEGKHEIIDTGFIL